MNTVRAWLTNTLMALAGLAAELRFMPRGRRNGLLAGGSALGVVALTATLLLTMGRAAPSQPPQLHLATATATTTHTAVPPTHTPRPKPTATATPIPLPPVQTTVQKPLPPPPPVPPKPPAPQCPDVAPTPTPKTSPAPTASARCLPCPYYLGNNPSQSEIEAALDSAATQYNVPKYMLYAVAWQESKWHEDVLSCDGGIGLLQVQYYYADYFNSLNFPTYCQIATSNYDPYTLQGNTLLGAKVLRYLYCYYTYGAGYGTPLAPGDGSSQGYYNAAGLAYPDLTKLDGTPNPNGLCATDFNAAQVLYNSLPSTTANPWSCPYSADPAKPNDATLLDIVLSAYNAGQGAIFNCGCIPNSSYVGSVESFIPQFAANNLPPVPTPAPLPPTPTALPPTPTIAVTPSSSPSP